MACTPETDETAAVYELSKTVVFWTNVCFAVYVLINGRRLSSTIGTVEEAARRIVVSMIGGKRLDTRYFEEDTVSARQRRAREWSQVDRHAILATRLRRTTALSAGRQWIYDLLEKMFGILSDVVDADDDHRDRSARPSKSNGIYLRSFRNLNTISVSTDAETAGKSSQVVCTTCGQNVV